MYPQSICALLLIIATLDRVHGTNECLDTTCALVDEPTLRFALIGDTGGLPVYPYYTPAQTGVAETLDLMRARKHIHFHINTGDNFYFNGVSNEFDHRFQKSFTNIYMKDQTNALGIPWYMMAGNHDYFGNISAQIAYSKRLPEWVYPSTYYNFSYSFGDTESPTTAHFIVIDTIQLCGNTRDVQNGSFFSMMTAKKNKQPPGPEDVVKANRQWQWLNDTLWQSRADYLFVAGHYPIFSVADHGPTECLVERLRPLLMHYRVSAYLSGHDHTLQPTAITAPINALLQHITEPSPAAGGGEPLAYIVSGAGSRADPSRVHINDITPATAHYVYPPADSGWNPLSQLGIGATGALAYAELGQDVGTFEFFDGKGRNLYNFTLPKRQSWRRFNV